VSDDPAVVARRDGLTQRAVRRRTCQPRVLRPTTSTSRTVRDKGSVRRLPRRNISLESSEIATIGDMSNDCVDVRSFGNEVSPWATQATKSRAQPLTSRCPTKMKDSLTRSRNTSLKYCAGLQSPSQLVREHLDSRQSLGIPSSLGTRVPRHATGHRYAEVAPSLSHHPANTGQTVIDVSK